MEILRGYSMVRSEKFGFFYLKHTDYSSSEDLDELKENLMNKATKEGLPTLKQREKDILI